MQTQSPRDATDGTSELLDHVALTAATNVCALRTNMDRALTRVMAWLYPLLVLQSIPSFLAQRDPTALLAPVALAVAGLPCVLVILALQRRGAPSQPTLLAAASLYFVVVLLAGLSSRPSVPEAYLPWLVVVAPVFIASLALGARTVRTWAVGNALGLAAVTAVYAPRLPIDRLMMTIFSIAAFSLGASAGVRALRRKADAADAARLAANQRYDEAQRRLALDQERVRTDALIHDSLLNALLGAVAATSATTARVRDDAVRRALDAISILDDASTPAAPAAAGDASSSIATALEQELRPLRGTIELVLPRSVIAEIPPRVHDALVSAALQAVNNSLKHAGDDVRRVVEVGPVGAHGVRVSIHDDGSGFALDDIAAERLGVRVSIVKRVRAVGGSAQILSAPGAGTDVVLSWPPCEDPPGPPSPTTTKRLVVA